MTFIDGPGILVVGCQRGLGIHDRGSNRYGRGRQTFFQFDHGIPGGYRIALVHNQIGLVDADDIRAIHPRRLRGAGASDSQQGLVQFLAIVCEIQRHPAGGGIKGGSAGRCERFCEVPFRRRAHARQVLEP